MLQKVELLLCNLAFLMESLADIFDVPYLPYLQFRKCVHCKHAFAFKSPSYGPELEDNPSDGTLTQGPGPLVPDSLSVIE